MNYELIQKFSNFLNQLLLCPIGIALMLVGNVSLAVNNQHVGNHLYAHGTLQVAVGIEKHLVLPSVVIDQRLYLIYILRLIYADGINLNARLGLPFLVHLVDGIQLAVARLAPGSKEIDDKGLTPIGKGIRLNNLTVNVLQCYLRQLRMKG